MFQTGREIHVHCKSPANAGLSRLFIVRYATAESSRIAGISSGMLSRRVRVFSGRSSMALKELAVRNAKPSSHAYRLSDGGGLYLFVSPAGGRLWRWDHRFEGKGKMMTFGKYPAVTLAFARERHLQGRQLLAAGTDPMSDRKRATSQKRAADENAFVQVADKWFAHWQHGKSTRHTDSTRRRLSTNIAPFSGTSL